MRAILLVVTLIVMSRPIPINGQVLAPLSDAAEASVLTMLPGDGLHALFGHTAIRISDPVNGVDFVYNYGTFDFGDPLFIPRFVYGQMDYFLSVPSFDRTVYHYQHVEGRPVLEQVLNLTPPEVMQMFAFLERNALPEHRYYRYDFFFDNCSTRPRDVIEYVLGDRLNYGGEALETKSFREHLAPFLIHRPLLRDGMFLLLGTPADRVAAPRETMFLPTVLFDVLEQATILRDVEEPLVSRSDTIAWVEGYTAPRPALPWGFLVMTALLIWGSIVSVQDVRLQRAPSLLADSILFGVVGIIGIVILLMGYLSQHTVTAPNLHIAWAWPTHVLVAGALRHRHATAYLLLAAFVTFAFSALWAFWPQALPVAFLPLALLTAVRALSRGMIQHRLRTASIAA